MTNFSNNDIEMIINETYDSLEKNHFGTLGRKNELMWERPLIGIAAGR
jgi:hypothetical protein